MDLDDFRSLDFTDPESARDWLENNPDLTLAEQRRVESWISEWESDNGQEFVSGLNRHSDVISNEVAGLIEAMDDDLRAAAEVPGLLKKGRITRAEATKRLAQLARNRTSYKARLEAISGSIERWQSNAEAGPTELIREKQERFKTGFPGYGKRSLTASILRGERS